MEAGFSFDAGLLCRHMCTAANWAFGSKAVSNDIEKNCHLFEIANRESTALLHVQHPQTRRSFCGFVFHLVAKSQRISTLALNFRSDPDGSYLWKC